MKKLISMITIIALTCSFSFAQNGYVTNQYKDKLIFINAIPAAEYDVVGKAKYNNSKTNEQKTIGDATGFAHIVIALDDANKKVEKGKQEDYDAAIIYGPLKIELIKFKSDDKEANRKCTVGVKDYSKKCGSKIMYFMSLPTNAYDVVKDVEVSNFTNLGQMKMGKNINDNFLNKLYERSYKEIKKNGLDFDAIIFDDPNVVNNRGLISLKTITLIKFK